MKTFSLIICLFSLFSAACSAQAQETSNIKWVVKVFSQPCQDPAKKKEGSGVVFTENGQTYLLTSEHVIYHGDNQICHSVQSSGLGKLKAKLLSVDWEKGMALLKINTDLPESPPGLDQLLENSGPQGTSALSTAAYPAKSSELLIDRQNTVLLKKSKRHLIPGLPYMIETKGLKGDYGMSGGAMFNQDGKMAGLLSHQSLKSMPGAASQVINTAEVDPSSHLLSIPASEISLWLRKTLDQPQRETFRRDIGADLQGKEIIQGFGLSFRPSAASRPMTSRRGGNGDGVGIGGDGDDEQGSISLQVTNEILNQHFGSPDKLKRIKQQLPLQAAATITSFVRIDLEQLLIEKKFFHSVAEFFSLMNDPELEAIVIVKGEELKNSQLLHRAEVAKGLIEAVEKSLQDVQKFESNQIKLAVDIISQGQGDLISDRLIQSLLNQAETWSAIFNADFDKGVELNSQLRAIQEILKKGRI